MKKGELESMLEDLYVNREVQKKFDWDFIHGASEKITESISESISSLGGYIAKEKANEEKSDAMKADVVEYESLVAKYSSTYRTLFNSRLINLRAQQKAPGHDANVLLNEAKEYERDVLAFKTGPVAQAVTDKLDELITNYWDFKDGKFQVELRGIAQTWEKINSEWNASIPGEQDSSQVEKSYARRFWTWITEN